MKGSIAKWFTGLIVYELMLSQSAKSEDRVGEQNKKKRSETGDGKGIGWGGGDGK